MRFSGTRLRCFDPHDSNAHVQFFAMSWGHGIRLRGYDYSSPGWYFITTVVERRRSLFGRVTPSGMQLTPLGQIVEDAYRATLGYRPWVTTDVFVVMPDHFHAIVAWQNTPDNRVDISLGKFVAQHKSLVTRRAVGVGLIRPWERIWQRGFWDVIIRSPSHLRAVRRYVAENPMKAATSWKTDAG